MARGGDNLLTLAILGVGGYLVYTNWSTLFPTTTTTTGKICKFPNGMTIAQNADGTCPFDSSKGGQSTPSS